MAAVQQKVTTAEPSASSARTPLRFTTDRMHISNGKAIPGFKAALEAYTPSKSQDQNLEAHLIKVADDRFYFPVLQKLADGRFVPDPKQVGFFIVAPPLATDSNYAPKNNGGPVIITKVLGNPMKGGKKEGKSEVYNIDDTSSDTPQDTTQSPIGRPRNAIVRNLRTLVETRADQIRTKLEASPDSKPKKRKKKTENKKGKPREGVCFNLKNGKQAIKSLHVVMKEGVISNPAITEDSLAFTASHAQKTVAQSGRSRVNHKFRITISDREGTPFEKPNDNRRLSAKLHAKVLEGEDKGQEQNFEIYTKNRTEWIPPKPVHSKILNTIREFLFGQELTELG